MKVEIKQLPAMRVGAVHHVGPYQQIGAAFGKLGEIAGRAGLLGSTPPMMVAIYNENPKSVAADKLTSEAGVVVSADARLPAELAEHDIPAGEYATTIHAGPYDGLTAAWSQFMNEWLPNSGRTPKRPTYEVYLNTPMDTKPEDLRTELRIALSTS